MCIACRKTLDREYQLRRHRASPEATRERARRWRAENADILRLKHQGWWQRVKADPARLAARREKARQATAAWRDRQRERAA
jgi:hypothetical protein